MLTNAKTRIVKIIFEFFTTKIDIFFILFKQQQKSIFLKLLVVDKSHQMLIS